jgi:WD40 repeat protein
MGHSGRVNAVRISPAGDRAVTVSDDQTARVWDLCSGECLHVLQVRTANHPQREPRCRECQGRACSGCWEELAPSSELARTSSAQIVAHGAMHRMEHVSGDLG